MLNVRHPLWISFLLVLAIFLPTFAAKPSGQTLSQAPIGGMKWRLIGPFRGGRALAVTGVPGQPDVFYFGAVGGGVWKSGDAGMVWKSVFDGRPFASIGAIAVAPSDPRVIYVGTGEADMRSDISPGNGIYKSTDAGQSWKFCGLDDSEQIGSILVDPHNPNVVYVAALGHAYGPNPERGVFRSTDGCATWQKVLYKNADTGAIDLSLDPDNSQVIYAALWQTRRPPWNVYPPSSGPGSGLYKSADGGSTWVQLSSHGLPSEGLGRIGVSVSPADPQRVYLIVDSEHGGVYRSDDSGRTWRRMDNEGRIWKRGWYFGGITADPKDANTVYVANTSLYRSRDGGKTFVAIKGAPGGDDYHTLWINPDDPNRMILGSDQGVIVSVDGAKTWSSWYNQPTGQFYHVVTDHRFPFWVYGAQQDSGSMALPERSLYGTLSSLDWYPISVGGEAGYIAPDPLHSGVLYGVSFGSSIAEYDMTNGLDRLVPPTLAYPGNYRKTWTQPAVFSPRKGRELYFGTQVLFRTLDDGNSWEVVSPDLTRPHPGVPPNLDAPAAADTNGTPPRGVIYAIAPSPVQAGTVWIGTDDGLIQVTHNDGKTWHNVTPPQLTAWSKVSLIEASHYDVNTAYAAVDRHRLDDFRPYIYSTHDGGKTWKLINQGIPEGSFARAVREDPERKGLLYAGTETGVFVSFDDGNQWQPLQLNLPHASVRDLAICDNDLVAATHGRAFWVLDDVTPLRQMSAQIERSVAWLFKPATAYRIQSGTDQGTPLPPEIPQAQNPPKGAIFDYILRENAAQPVTLTILDAMGRTVREFSSADVPPKVNPRLLDIPMYWIKPGERLAATAGMHRFVWDLHCQGAGNTNPAFAMFGRGLGPWAVPGAYKVELQVDGRTYSRPLTVVMDPDVQTSQKALQQQFESAQETMDLIRQVRKISEQGARLVHRTSALQSAAKAHAEVEREVGSLMANVQAILGTAGEVSNPDFAGVGGPPPPLVSVRRLSASLAMLESAIESGASAPSADAVKALADDRQETAVLQTKWEKTLTIDLPRVNALLRSAGLSRLTARAKSQSTPANKPVSFEDD
jgi:photosystem II stability/assembly factor-like uncharacterized protein